MSVRFSSVEYLFDEKELRVRALQLTWQFWSSRWVVLPKENEGFRFEDGFGLRLVFKQAFGGLPESFCELQGGPKWSK